MMYSMRCLGLLLIVLCLPSYGCIVVCGTCWDCDSPKVWVEQSEEMDVPLDEVSSLNVKSLNGSVRAEGKPGLTAVRVVVHKRAGGRDQDDAQACMDALQVKSEKAGSTQRLTTECSGPRKSHWSWVTNYEVQLPQSVALEVVTHNGEVSVTDLQARCDLETHNGRVRLKGIRGEVRAETHNGQIEADVVASRIELTTHNGGIDADLSGVGAVEGHISTHNGSIELALGEQASTQLNCSTHNGSISSELALTDVVVERHTLKGRLGGGTGELEVVTHNGSIELDD